MKRPDKSAADVAAWMLKELKREGELYQQSAADDITEKFGAQFIYDNERSGHPAISKEVLKAFSVISGDDVVWERRQKLWRFREEGDEPGRLQP